MHGISHAPTTYNWALLLYAETIFYETISHYAYNLKWSPMSHYHFSFPLFPPLLLLALNAFSDHEAEI